MEQLNEDEFRDGQFDDDEELMTAQKVSIYSNFLFITAKYKFIPIGH